MPETRRVQASNEFELDGRRVVLIDTPGLESSRRTLAIRLRMTFERVIENIQEFLAESYVKT